MGSDFTPGEHSVFVVDSDKRYCDEITALLRRIGYHVRKFGTAEDLLDAVDRGSGPACVISEIALPGMSGLDLARKMQQRNSAVPVIILTRQCDVATAVRALRNNVSDYLVKPFVERDLVNRLRVAIEHQAMPVH